MPIALTQALKMRKSAIRIFFEEHFPNRSLISRDVRERTHGVETILPRRPQGFPRTTVGMAIDHRIRLYFPPPGTAAETLATTWVGTIATAASPAPWLEPLGREFIRDFLEIIRGHSLVGHRLSAVKERDICRRCFVAALFEEVYRAGLQAGSPLLALTPDATVADLLRIPSSAVLDDLRDLSWTFHDSQQALFGVKVTLGPTFGGLGHSIQADADMVAGRCLIEIKTVKDAASIPPTTWPWQMLGYALLDFDDAFRLDEIALYLARQGLLVSWSLEDFLQKLGGTESLAEARAAFRSIL